MESDRYYRSGHIPGVRVDVPPELREGGMPYFDYLVHCTCDSCKQVAPITILAWNDAGYLCKNCWTGATEINWFDLAQEDINKRKETPMSPASTIPQCWKDAEAALTHARLTLLYGPPGTGKTHAAMTYGDPDSPFALTLHEETSADELRGFYVPVDGRFEWQDGPAMLAWREGKRLVLNELDHASGDTLSLALAILDDMDIAALTLPTGETVHPHKGFHCVATINGDPDELPPALRDRFTVAVEIDRPHPAAIKSLPENLRNIAKGTSEGHYSIIRKGDGTESTERSHSVRSWKCFAELTKSGMNEKVAARIIFGDSGAEVLNAIKIGA